MYGKLEIKNNPERFIIDRVVKKMKLMAKIAKNYVK